MLIKKIRIDLRHATPIFTEIKDLRNLNSIAQQILDQSINTLLTTATYSSFTEAINDLFDKNIIDSDKLDEIFFKHWIAMDHTFYLLEDFINKYKLSTIESIKEFVNNVTIDDIKNYLFNNIYNITTPLHLEQELGIRFNISIDVFFVRFVNHAQFFNNEVKIYIDNQSKLTEYILYDLKNNIDTYINKIYIMHKNSYL